MNHDLKLSPSPAEAPAGRLSRAFLSQVRHDLRTPVNAIIGYGEMLVEDAEEPPPEDFAAVLGELPALGKTLLNMVGELLDASKADRDDIDPETFGAEVRRTMAIPCHRVVEVCNQLLEQAGRLSLPAFVPDLKRIREAAERFLELQEEFLNFARNEPEGAARLAAATAQPAAPPVPSAGPAPAVPLPGEDGPTSSHLQGHILVVDDNEFNRDLLGRAVQRLGHTFAVATNGRQALEMLRSQPFDLLLLDVNMPEMGGVEVLQQLKPDPQLSHIPVIVVSTSDEIDIVVRCIELGAEDYLPKPPPPVLLKARIGACLEKKRLRDQELDYLRNVAILTNAAAAVESGTYESGPLAEVAQRTDALGKLAEMFRSMVRQVEAREQRLKQEVQQLKVEIDESRKAKHVAEVTETSYFRDLQQRVQSLKKRRQGGQ